MEQRGDVNTTEKVICSPWVHPSGIQQHKLNLSQHQHIINPRTWLYWKNLMNARLRKQYCNTIPDRNILDLQSISFSYAMSTAYHKYNLWSENGFIFTWKSGFQQRDEEKSGKEILKHIVIVLQIWKSSQIKAAINKPATKWLCFTYEQPTMFQVLLSSSLLGTRWLTVCSLLATNIKDAHTELISCGHLYNNTFAQSLWCSFDLEQWLILPFGMWWILWNGFKLNIVH